MNILGITDKELYEIGLAELKVQLGPACTERFLRQCKPSDPDYTAERHKWLANQPDIPTIAKRINRGKPSERRKNASKPSESLYGVRDY